MSVMDELLSGRPITLQSKIDPVEPIALSTATDYKIAFGNIQGVERVEVDEEVGCVRITVHLEKGFIARQVRRQCEAIVHNHAPMWLDVSVSIVEHSGKSYWPKYLGYHLNRPWLDIDDVIYLRGQ